MAFDKDGLSLLIGDLGGFGPRIWNYKTDDSESTILGAGYLAQAEAMGVKEADLVIVSYLDGSAREGLVARVGAIDSAGAATLELDADEGELYFPTRAAVQNRVVPGAVGRVKIGGYATENDGGAATYKRVASEPSHAGKIQSVDGAWWELEATAFVTPMQFGAAGDGTTNDKSAMDDVIAYINAVDGHLVLDGGGRSFATSGTIQFSHSLAMRNATLIRATGWSGNSIVNPTDGTFVAENCTFDGNKNNVTDSAFCVFIQCPDSTIRGCLIENAANWSGIRVDGGGGNTERHIIDGCQVKNNDEYGVYKQDGNNLTIVNSYIAFNGDGGVSARHFDASVLVASLRIESNKIQGNGGSGIAIGNFNTDDVPASGNTGFTDPDAVRIVVANNTVWDNEGYGIFVAADEAVVSGNIVRANGTAGGSEAGLLIAGRGIAVSGNYVAVNLGWGIDGVGQYCSVNGNVIRNNSSQGINLGFGQRTSITGNLFEGNGGTGGYQLQGFRVEGGGGGGSDVESGDGCVIAGNTFLLFDSHRAIRLRDGIVGAHIVNNVLSFTSTTYMEDACLIIAKQSIIAGNKYASTTNPAILLDGSDNLIVPDLQEEVSINTTNAVENVRPYTQSLTHEGVAWVEMTDGGSGYTSEPTVSFVGGGGSGAVGDAFINGSGEVVGVRVTSFGSGYTSAPTVSFSGGGGSGAAATAQVGTPLPYRRKLEIYSFQDTSVKRGGDPAVFHPVSSDITLPSRAVLTLTEVSGGWTATSLVDERDAANLTGTLAEARLTSNVALYDATTANFTGDLQRGGHTVARIRKVTIADDAAYSFDPPSFEGGYLVQSGNKEMIWFGANDTNGVCWEAVSSGSVSLVNDTALSGTDGVDGDLTVSANGGSVYIENRLGSSQDVFILELSI